MLLLPPLLLLLCPPTPAEPLFDPPRGFYEESFTLELAPSEADAQVYYTLGGAAPSTPYQVPLLISGTTVVRALEVFADGSTSEVTTHTYLFVADTIADPDMETRITADPVYGPLMVPSLLAVPSISIAIPGAISGTEQAASVEWLDPAGESFQVDAGFNIAGGTTVAYEKNTYRLHFRAEYGAGRLEWPLYDSDDFATGVWPADSFDALTLRCGNHDAPIWLGTRGQYLRNRWIDETQLAMGHVVPHGRWVQLYTNGDYRGHYHVREHYNGAFMASYLGGDEEDWETVNSGTPVDSDGAAWAAAKAASYRYDEAVHWIHVQNLVDYMLVNQYGVNAWDWSTNHNWKAAGPRAPDQGGFQFHSHDSDIILCYAYTTDMTGYPGPDSMYGNLLAQGDPDFLTLLADRIYLHLFNDGALSETACADRYQRLLEQIELSIVAESARWGQGYWERDEDWVQEQDRLFTDFFPLRSAEMVRQLRAAGHYPLDAPTFSAEGADVAPGFTLDVGLPEGVEADIWLTTDGHDPREPGGTTAASAQGPYTQTSVQMATTTEIKARLLQGRVWGPLHAGIFRVAELPPLVLNEWNAVDDDETLDEDGQDLRLGQVMGNGGDWFELVVLQAGLDLRGWRLELAHRNGSAGALSFTDDAVWQDLRAGTLITVVKDLDEDLSLDPSAGDWWIQVRAGTQGSGVATSATDFQVSPRDWQLTIRDGDGHIRFGPAGEGVDPRHGISGREVGILKDDPSPGVRRDQGYGDSHTSTLGAPNRWDDGEQDFTALRSGAGSATDLDDTASPDSGPPADDGPPGADPGEAAGGSCGAGCATQGQQAPWLALWLALAGLSAARSRPAPRAPTRRKPATRSRGAPSRRP